MVEWIFEEDSLTPICPYCEKEIKKVLELEASTENKSWLKSKVYKNSLIVCPECKKIIGACSSTHW